MNNQNLLSLKIKRKYDEKNVQKNCEETTKSW